MFTYDEVNQHYFLNSSMEDTFLIEQAIRHLHEHLNQWRNGQRGAPFRSSHCERGVGQTGARQHPAIIREERARARWWSA
jgi:hypothetical protein